MIEDLFEYKEVNPEVDLYYNGKKAFSTYQYGVNYYFDDGRSYASSTTSASYAASDTSDSAIATQYALQSYAEKLANRMYEDNLKDVDKDYVAGMIYAILMKEDIPKSTVERLMDDRPGNEKLFKDEDFLIWKMF